MFPRESRVGVSLVVPLMAMAASVSAFAGSVIVGSVSGSMSATIEGQSPPGSGACGHTGARSGRCVWS